jgi:hypothetical protein
MRRAVMYILLFACSIFAAGPNDDYPESGDCFNIISMLDDFNIISVKGMQLRKNLADSTIIGLHQTASFSGIVDSVVDTAYIEYITSNGKISSEKGLFYIGADSTEKYSKRITLQRFEKHGNAESSMDKILDSSWIFVPHEIDVNTGDSIYIKDYSAMFTSIWNNGENCTLQHWANLKGEFFVTHGNFLGLQNPNISIKQTRKMHNRDAKGKKSLNCNTRKARF